VVEAIELHKEPWLSPTWRANCHMVRSRQSTGVLIPVVYLFGGEESKAKNSKSHTSMRNTETRRVYTGSGLRRVIPYVQLSVWIA
jgi:hypothetical protein